ncbi:MAG: Ig-like domain repeat protein [Acidobacteria bacterium]|nr:Ig-like domain repeat protein [Acidobacteriota bacterium]
MQGPWIKFAVAFLAVSALGFQFTRTSLPIQNLPVLPRVTQPVDERERVILKGNTHPLARAQYDRGIAPPELPLSRMLLVLRRSPEQETALRRLLEEQQDKNSPNYHKWLTPQEFGKTFGPRDEDIQVTTAWLEGHGFQIAQLSQGRSTIEFSGKASQVEETFGTAIHKYVVNGSEHWANAADPRIPLALAPVVAGLASLNNFHRKSFSRVLGPVRRSKQTGQMQPLFTFTPPGVPTLYALGPTDFATIYNVQRLWSSGIDGTGQTLAIVGDSDININDVAQFRSIFGLPPNNPTVLYNGPNPGTNGAETEALLDVEWSGAVARNASIDYVVSEDTETTAGIDLSAVYIVDNNLAPVMSESFGMCEAALGTSGNLFINMLWSQAAAQGITVLTSTGDGGSAGCDDFNVATQAQFGLAVSGYASTPFNIAVGGTDFDQLDKWSTYWNASNTGTTNSSAKSYIPEMTWNDSCAVAGANGCTATTSKFLFNIVAGSGGPSNCSNSSTSGGFIQCSNGTAKPSWQTGAGVPQDFLRDTPDVALFAGNGFTESFYIICQSDAVPLGACDLNAPYSDFLGVGGTSASAPAFAGVMALVNQKEGSRQGQANYVLYPLASQPGRRCNSSTAPPNSSSCIFYDITKGNNSVPCIAGSPNCGAGPVGGSGILVSPTSPVPAWTTTPGYDLATGLGSVNVTNLVNSWNSNFVPSATTLSLSPSTITHGQPVNVTITVSPQVNGGVSLVGQPTTNVQGIEGLVLNGGTASGTTTLLPGGPSPSQSYFVWAHYPGNGSYGASDSNRIAVSVSPEASHTLLHLVTFDPNTGQVINNQATTVAYGSPYLLRVDIENAMFQTCPSPPQLRSGCPSGTIQLTNNGNPLGKTGSLILNSLGYLEDQLIFSEFGVGTQLVQASYAGDNSYTSSSANATFRVTQDPTALAATTTPNSAGAIFNARLATTSAVAAPTGIIAFQIDGQVVSSVPVAGVAGSGSFQSALNFASGTATLPDPTIANGPHTLVTSYSGDTNYSASTSAPLSFNLQPDFTMLSSSPSITIANPGGGGSLSLSVSPLDGFSGSISFTCAGLPLESACNFVPATIKASGSTVVTVTTTSPKSTGVYHHHLLWTASSIGAAGIFLLGVPRQKRGWSKVLELAVILLFVVALGCGSGGSGSGTLVSRDPGTSAGTYNVRINATSGTLVHQVGFQLVIQ